jgi:hypothetical protein
MIQKLQNKFAELRRADRKIQWLLDQVKWRYFTFRHKKQLRLNREFDSKHRIETAPELALETAGVPLSEVARGNGVYRPISEKLFRTALASVRIDPAKFTFVDIGSGMGKVLFMAADQPFKRIIGVEYALGLHEVAVRNVATYRSDTQKCNAIEPVHADALEYALPTGPLLLFIFNALAAQIMRDMLSRLDAGVASTPDRPILLIYTNIRTVKEAGGVFGELRNLRVIHQKRNFVIVANAAGRAVAA